MENTDNKITEKYKKLYGNTSTESLLNSSSIESEKDISDKTYSDGYFNYSIEKLYHLYNKMKMNSASTTNEEQPTGCFDESKDSVNKQSSRCSLKLAIIISITTLCMLVAVTTATILTFHVFTKDHTKHFHGITMKEENSEVYQHGAVVTGSTVCSSIGADILRANGSAIDATVASAFCLGITNKYSSGIGGGGFMLVYIRENKTFDAIDFFGTAPGRSKKDMFENNVTTSKYGGKAIAVPGEVKGLLYAWSKYGRLPWKQLVQPSIDLAVHGIYVQMRAHEIAETKKELIQDDPGLKKLLLAANGEPFEPGYLMKDRILAQTLTIIRDQPEDFYSGSLSEKITKEIREAGGIVTLDDLANYKIQTRDIVTSNIGSLTFNTISAPTGGPVVAHILNILKGYHLSAADTKPSNIDTTYHRIIEAMKFAFAQRTKEGDPEYNDRGLMDELIHNMTDEGNAEVYRQMIDDKATKHYMFYRPEYNIGFDKGTSHISIIAPNGDAASMTTSINDWFGSMYRSLETGVIYNNFMKDFTTTKDNEFQNLPPSPFNSIHGGKRPLSSMSPIIITSKTGDVKFVLGGIGGIRIIPAVTQVIINKLWFGDDLSKAIYRPRFYYNGMSSIILDPTNDEQYLKIKNELHQRNHSVMFPVNSLEYSAVHGIYVDDNGELYTKSDYRKYGHADGF